MTFCDRPRPRSVGDAQFSLQYCAALALLGKAPTLDDFAPGAWERPRLTDLMQRVEVAETTPFTDRYPGHFGARVTVVDAGGTQNREVRDTLGDPARPLDEAAHLEKLRMLLPLRDSSAARRWADAVLSLDGAADSAALCAALGAAAA